jgi:ABC-type lipoprotein export system ATPase subunit
MADPIISIYNVSHSYNDGRLTSIARVTLHIMAGKYVVITGPSGSGKSTLLHLMRGIDHPTDGEVHFDGRLPTSPGEWRHLRAKRIGLVFQSFNLLPKMTAVENVEVPMFGLVGRVSKRRQRAMYLLERVGLAG